MFIRRGYYQCFCLLIILASVFLLFLWSDAIQAFLVYPHSAYKKITQYFDDSYTRQHGLPYYVGHKGTDYDAPLGTEIYAAADGQIIKVANGSGDGCQRNTSDSGGFGNHIIIAHPNGYYTIYAHLRKGSAKVGQDATVKAGDLLGLVGSSGRTYGSDACGTFEHLHFEVRSQRYGHHVNPYNLNTGCLFIGGCDKPQLPIHKPKSPESTYPLDRLGWLDIFKDVDPPVPFLATGSYDGGSRSGLHTASATTDGHIYYHEVWWDTPEREQGNILDRLYKLDPLGNKNRKVTAMTSGNFGGGKDDILAVAFAGDDTIFFYHRQRKLGHLDSHPGRPAINHLATGDIDNDGRAELLATVPDDDHIYLFDRWNGHTFKQKAGFLDAHGGNPTISALATMDIDFNGYDELLVATGADDHIYEYYFDHNKAKKWWKFWRTLPQPFVKQGFLDCHGDQNSPHINPRITGITVGKFQDQIDHLAVTTAVDDHIYFYWERDLAKAWNGKILRQKKFKNAFTETEQPIIQTMTAGDFDDSGDDELVLATTGNDHLSFFGHEDGGGYVGYGGDEDFYNAELVAQSTKRVLLRPGQIASIWVEFKNTGNIPWQNNSLPEFQLRLDPNERNSIFYNDSWPQENAPTKLSAGKVDMGSVTRLHFKIKAPIYSGQYIEYLRLYKGSRSFDQTAVRLDITVDGEPPSQISNLRANTKKSHWRQNYTNDDAPTFVWDKARDFLSGIDGYYLAIDDPTPDGLHQYDWRLDRVTTWTTPRPLSNDWYTVAITSRDKAGNVNPTNTNRVGDAPYIKFMVDTEVPNPPVAIQPDTTRSIWQKIQYQDGQKKNITASRQPAFIWPAGSDKHSGVQGYEIAMFNAKREKIIDLTLKTLNNSATTWRYPAVLPDGEYRFDIKTIDRADNLSAATSYVFAVDTTPPTGSLLINDNDIYTNNLQISLNISSKDPSLVTAFSLSNDNLKWQEFPLKKGAGPSLHYSAPWQLATGNGTRTVRVKFRDSVGHWSRSFTDSIILDTEKPDSWINDLSIWQNTLSFFVSWFSQDNLSDSKYFDVQYKDSLTNKWITWLSQTKLVGKFFTGLDGVTYWFRSRSYDQADNQENYPPVPDTETTIDITKPDPPHIKKPINNSTFNAQADENQTTAGLQKTTSGTAEADSQLTLEVINNIAKIKSKYSAQTNNLGNWQVANVTLTEGENIIKATATDSAGNWNNSGNHVIWLDTIAPAAIVDLAADNTTYHSTILTWITPGDDNQQGTAKSYDIRYSLQPITTTNFTSAQPVTQIPAPEKAGIVQNLIIDSLDPKETYYFALKSVDEANNWSKISSVPTAKTSTSANSITLVSNQNILAAEGYQKATLTIGVYDPASQTGPKLAGENITLAITKNNGHLSQTGTLSLLKDNGDGSYNAIYTAAPKVGNGQITITADCVTCLSPATVSTNIKLIPGHPAGEIKLNAQPLQIKADGSNTTRITSQSITDKTGNQVADGEMITVSTQLGSIITPDVDATRSGTQISTKKGIIDFIIRSPRWNGYGQASKQTIVTAKSVAGSGQGQIKPTFQDVTAPPSPIITTPANNGYGNDNAPMISGTAEKKARILIYVNNKYHHYVYANSAGKFSYTFNKVLSDGKYEFKTKARDAAGNTSNYSKAVKTTIDTVAPTISSHSPTGTVHHRQNNILVNYHDNPGGSGIDNSRTQLKFQGSVVSTGVPTKPAAMTIPGGTFLNYRVTVAEKNSSYQIQAIVTDRAGNTTSISWSFTVQLFTYLKSRVENGYRSSIVSNWPNSKGLIPSPNWWDPKFNDNGWRKAIYIAYLPPNSVPKPEATTEWLWGDTRVDPNETTLLRKYFTIPEGVTIDDAAIRMSADNEAWGFVGFLNGHYFGKVPEALSGGNPYLFGLKKLIRPGNNLLAIQVSNGNDRRAGVAYTLTIKYHD